MDGFSYHNIFDTKGIEYLVIIAFFLILVPFWILLNRQVKITKELQRKIGTLTANALRIPQGIFFSQNHTWTHLDKNGVARVGMDDLLLHLTGAVKINTLKKPGEIIQKGDYLADLEHNGKSIKITSPISGEIIDHNHLLPDHPELLSEDPYQKGWLYQVKPSRWIAETSSFYLAEEASRWSEKEIERFKDFLAASVQKYTEDPSHLVLQDGGELIDHPLAELPADVWQDFQHSYLGVKSKYPHFKSLGKQEFDSEYF